MNGRGGIGWNRQGRRESLYGLEYDPTVEFANAVVLMSDRMIEFSRSLSRLQGELLELGDAKAAKAAAAAGAAAGAASRLSRELHQTGMTTGDYINNVVTEAITNIQGAIAGSFSKSFNGTPNQELTQTINDDSITVNAIGYCWYAPPSHDPYMSSFPAWTDSVSAGSLTFKIRNAGAAPSASYPFQYIIVPDG
jgi:hypothetical protein